MDQSAIVDMCQIALFEELHFIINGMMKNRYLHPSSIKDMCLVKDGNCYVGCMIRLHSNAVMIYVKIGFRGKGVARRMVKAFPLSDDALYFCGDNDQTNSVLESLYGNSSMLLKEFLIHVHSDELHSVFGLNEELLDDIYDKFIKLNESKKSYSLKYGKTLHEFVLCIAGTHYKFSWNNGSVNVADCPDYDGNVVPMHHQRKSFTRNNFISRICRFMVLENFD